MISPFVIVITGAQGVGKSTFCRSLYEVLRGRYGDRRVALIDGLGDKIRASGYAVGSGADAGGVAAIFREHLRREREIEVDIAILDRCAIDALAYVRVLNANTIIEKALYEEVTRTMSKRWNAIVRLELSETFAEKCAAHEDPEFRTRIDQQVSAVIKEFDLPACFVDAADAAAVARIAKLIVDQVR